MQWALEVSPGKPILIDKFLESAIEVDVDCLNDGQRTLIGKGWANREQRLRA